MAKKNDQAELMGKFSDARSLLECALYGLEGSELPVGPETVCLRQGLGILAEVYRELERG